MTIFNEMLDALNKTFDDGTEGVSWVFSPEGFAKLRAAVNEHNFRYLDYQGGKLFDLPYEVSLDAGDKLFELKTKPYIRIGFDIEDAHKPYPK